MRNDVSHALVRLNDRMTGADTLLVTDNDGVYHIANDDTLSAILREVHDGLDSVVFSEDDRTYVRDTRAEVNKFTKRLNDAILSEERRVLDGVKSRRTEVVADLKDIAQGLSDQLNDMDRRRRDEARAQLSSQFDDAVELAGLSDRLGGLTFDDIEDTSWSNRSASMNKSIAALQSRIDALDGLLRVDSTVSAQEAVTVLSEHEWNVGAAVVALSEAKAAREEAARQAAEAKAARQAEIKEAEERGRRAAEAEAARKEAERQAAKATAAPNDSAGGTQSVTVTWTGDDASVERVRAALREAVADLDLDGVMVR